MQTFAGLALDKKSKGSPSTPSRSGLAAIQYLLNAFLFLNILHFLGLMGLAELDRRRKLANSLTSSFRGHSGQRADESSQSTPTSPKSGDHAEDEDDMEGPIRLPLSAREGPFPSTSSPEQSITLLVPNSDRPDSTAPGPEQITNPHPSVLGSQGTKRARRGEFFAGICAAFIVFAWVLFLVTAWLRLRSKSERGGNTTGSPN